MRFADFGHETVRAGAKRVLTGIQIGERESAVSIEQQFERYRAAI